MGVDNATGSRPRVLVTGGAGFIGSALVRWLIETDRATVCTFDKLTYAGSLSSLRDVFESPRHRFVREDICDAAAVRAALASFQPDVVMHLAAESHVDRSIDAPAVFLETNVTGTYTLLQCVLDYWFGLPTARREHFRFHHVSTDEVYGSLGPQGSFTESSPYAPRSPYAASKASGDHFVRAWHATYGLPVLITNASNNYGPFHFPEKLIPLTILNAMEGRRLPVYGTGEHIRDWIHVEDHVRALWRVVQSGRAGATYNIGAGQERTNIEVVQTICAVLDRLRPRREGAYQDLIEMVADRPGHDLRYALDASRIRTELDWVPEYTFESGLDATVRWYIANSWWWQPIRDHRYAGRRLGHVADTGSL